MAAEGEGVNRSEVNRWNHLPWGKGAIRSSPMPLACHPKPLPPSLLPCPSTSPPALPTHPPPPLQVCAHMLSKLLAGGRQLPTPELMRAWRDAVPDGMQPSPEMLRGEALILGKG